MGKFKVGIVGCGLIGKKRADNLAGSELVIVADKDEEKAKELSSEHNCKHSTDYMDVINSDADIVIVSTSNDVLVEVALAAVKNGKHILLEKPCARNAEEFKKLLDAAEGKNIKIKTGYNHRYHPAILKAKELIEKKEFGELMYIRARYGHGGRPGYDKEWRAKKEISGGGEMLDQGCHLIDLGRMFLGDFEDAKGYCKTYFWNMDVEDNCFALLKTKKGQIMQLHASWTEWKNLFSFEIFCRNAKLEITGLGRSYGTETLIVYKMKPEMGIPDKEVFTFEDEDVSWQQDFEALVQAIENNRKLPDIDIAYRNLLDISSIYSWSSGN